MVLLVTLVSSPVSISGEVLVDFDDFTGVTQVSTWLGISPPPDCSFPIESVLSQTGPKSSRR